jgi:cytochrome b561
MKGGDSMALRNSQGEYGVLSKLLHWVVFLLVAFQVWVGFFTEGMAKPVRHGLMGVHKSFGLLLLVLILLFIIWTLCNPHPKWSNRMPAWERALAKLSHTLLYLSVLFMSLTGWGMSTAAGKIPSFFGWFKAAMPGVVQTRAVTMWFHSAHGIAAWVLVTLVAIHILAALKHQFLDKDHLLRRMLPM